MTEQADRATNAPPPGTIPATIETKPAAPGSGPGQALERLADTARSYAAARSSTNTRKAYASDWAQFARWCRRKGFDVREPSAEVGRALPRRLGVRRRNSQGDGLDDGAKARRHHHLLPARDFPPPPEPPHPRRDGRYQAHPRPATETKGGTSSPRTSSPCARCSRTIRGAIATAPSCSAASRAACAARRSPGSIADRSRPRMAEAGSRFLGMARCSPSVARSAGEPSRLGADRG